MSGVIIENCDEETVVFKFANGSLVVTIRQGDLSAENCDAIVNSTNLSMDPTGGLDAIIHQTMGQYYSDQVTAISNKMRDQACPVGKSRIFIAKFKRDKAVGCFVINTVGPLYKKEEAKQAAFFLQSCYKTTLELANLYDLSSIAYPAISCGAHGFPPNEAAKVAIESVRQYSQQIKDVRFVLFDREIFNIFVQEWTDYSQKINREASIIDHTDHSSITPPPPLSSDRYCVLCRENQLPIDRQFLCIDCSNRSRSEIFQEILRRLQHAAEKSFDELKQECESLKSIFASYSLVYNPAQIFDQSIHDRDSVAEHYLQIHCDKKFRNAMPMAIVGDGNCFYNTFVRLGGVGTTTEESSITSVELRARNVVELVLNRHEYERNSTTSQAVLDNFQNYVTKEMVRDANYVAIWDFLSIPTVLNITVTSIYPKVNGDEDMYYQNLNSKTFIPLMSSNHSTTTTIPLNDVRILFSHCNKPSMKKGNWTPNHFVPLLNFR